MIVCTSFLKLTAVPAGGSAVTPSLASSLAHRARRRPARRSARRRAGAARDRRRREDGGFIRDSRAPFAAIPDTPRSLRRRRRKGRSCKPASAAAEEDFSGGLFLLHVLHGQGADPVLGRA